MMALNGNAIVEFTLQLSHTFNPNNTFNSGPTSEKIMKPKRIRPWTQVVSQTLVAKALIVYKLSPEDTPPSPGTQYWRLCAND